MRLRSRYGSLEAARAAALLLLALPGTLFLYVGQELGLEEADLADELRQDPIFFGSDGAQKGRDGCRVPIPWDREPPGFGFSERTPWLPIPQTWAPVSVAAQDKDATSPRALYRAALGVRRRSDALHSGSLTWRDAPAGALVFVREHHSDAIVCAVNVSADELPMPSGEVLLTSEPRLRDRLPANAAAWVRLPRR